MSAEQNQRPFGTVSILATVAIAVALVTGLNFINKNKIAYNTQRVQLKSIHALLPVGTTGDILSSQFSIRGEEGLGSANQLMVFRIIRDEEQIGIIMLPLITRGYSGPIELGIGIMKDDSISGVRVIKHTETTGLGDGIDHRVSDWILNFTGRSPANTPAEAWAVTTEGGEFDQLSGATITSRAVINAVNKAVNYHAENKRLFYRQP